MSDDGYLLPNSSAAGGRIALLAELYDEWTFRHLEACGVGPGWRCWEVGAGGGSVPRWLAERVGPNGHVLATDLDPVLLGDLPPPIEVRRHDLAADPPPTEQFDLVHARLVLIHVPARERALAAMVGALRPGGWLLVEDADPGLQPRAALQDGPAAERAQRIRDRQRVLVAARGADLALGRKLPALLRAAGLHQVSADAYLALAHPASALLEQMTVTLLRDALLGAGQVTAADLDAHLAALAAGELDVAQPALVSCRGRAPI